MTTVGMANSEIVLCDVVEFSLTRRLMRVGCCFAQRDGCFGGKDGAELLDTLATLCVELQQRRVGLKPNCSVTHLLVE